MPAQTWATKNISLPGKELFTKSKHLKDRYVSTSYIIWSCPSLQQKPLITPACISIVLVVFFFWLALGYNSSLLTPVHCVYSCSQPSATEKLFRGCIFIVGENVFIAVISVAFLSLLCLCKIAFSSSFDTSLNCESRRLWKYERYPVVHLFVGLFVIKPSCFSHCLSCSHPFCKVCYMQL